MARIALDELAFRNRVQLIQAGCRAVHHGHGDGSAGWCAI
jgi:hypothetical protein